MLGSCSANSAAGIGYRDRLAHARDRELRNGDPVRSRGFKVDGHPESGRVLGLGAPQHAVRMVSGALVAVDAADCAN